jgi:hypothetical protein
VAQLGGSGLPLGRDPAGLDLGLLGGRVALTRSRDQRGVDDLARHRDVAGRPERPIEAGKQDLDGRLSLEHRLRQALAKEPDRARVRDPVPEAEPQKAHERQTVVDEVLRPLVREAVGGLDHQDLEHQHRIERWPAALRPVRVGQRLVEGWAEHPKVHRSRERFQLIAQIAEPLQAILDVKETPVPTIARSKYGRTGARSRPSSHQAIRA